MKCPRCGKEVQFVTDYEWVCPNCGEDGIIEDSIVEKIKRVCRGCKFFSISIDGTEEYYECSNENRWIDLGYDEDDLFEYPEICIIAIAKYSFEGNLIDVDLRDIYFDFKGCKWKEEENG